MRKILIYYSQKSYGGVDTHLANLISNWPSQNDQFIILTNANNSGLSFLQENISTNNFEIITTSNLYDFNSDQWKVSKGLTWIKDNIKFIYEFIVKIKKIKPDIIISNNGGYPGGITCFTSAIISKFYTKNQSVFMLIHHAPDEKRSKIAFVADFLVIICKILSINFITVSLASEKMLQENTPIKKLKVIYNGVSVKKISWHKNRIRKMYNINKNKAIIGIIGPLDPHKGHKTLIDVFTQSSTIRKHAHLLIVGRGDENFVNYLKKYTLQNKVQNNITFTGFIEGASIDIISEFDLLAMPTIDFEAFGYSMAEAMSVKVPIIASSVGAIPEIIDHKINGLLVSPENLNDWLSNIKKLIQDEQLRKKISLNGHKTIKNNFSAKEMSKSYYNFLLNDHVKYN